MAFYSSDTSIPDAVNRFTDNDRTDREVPIVQVAFQETIGTAPRAVSDRQGLPVTLIGLDTINGYIDGIETSLTTITGHVDGLEASLTTIAGHVDGVETLLTSLGGYVDGLEGLLDGVEGSLADIETNTDSLAVVGNGAAATAQRVTLANDSTGVLATVTTVTTVGTLTGGGIAHDSADSGNPHKIGAIATASILGDTPVAAADRTNLKAGLDGALINRPYTSLEDIISEVKTNTDGASTAMTGAFAATASQRIYLTTLILANSSASAITVDIRDGSGGAVLATVPVPAGGGAVVPFPVPLRFSANTAAAFDGSAAATTLTVTMVGFKSKQ